MTTGCDGLLIERAGPKTRLVDTYQLNNYIILVQYMRISSVFQNLFMYPLKSIQQNNVVKFHHQVTNDLLGPFLDLLLQNLIWQSFLLTSQYSPSGIYTCGIKLMRSSSFHLYYIHVPQFKTISFLVEFNFHL